MADASTIARFAASIPTRVATAQKLVGFAVWNGVTVRTPVDTGRARASWNMAVGAADLSVAPDVEREAGQEGAIIPAPTPPDLGEIQPGEAIVISNNLPYIKALNDGHSGQAPAGFAQATVAEVLGKVDGIAREVRAEAEGGGAA